MQIQEAARANRKFFAAAGLRAAEFGFNVVRKKLLGACVKLKQFFVIVSPIGKCEVMEEPCGDRHQRIDKIMTTPERMLENGAVAWVSAKQASPLPSGGPDAQDQVSILASDGSYFHTGVWNIRRDREGTVVALDLFFRDERTSSCPRRSNATLLTATQATPRIFTPARRRTRAISSRNPGRIAEATSTESA
jgi:hypothetical protein